MSWLHMVHLWPPSGSYELRDSKVKNYYWPWRSFPFLLCQHFVKDITFAINFTKVAVTHDFSYSSCHWLNVAGNYFIKIFKFLDRFQKIVLKVMVFNPNNYPETIQSWKYFYWWLVSCCGLTPSVTRASSTYKLYIKALWNKLAFSYSQLYWIASQHPF